MIKKKIISRIGDKPKNDVDMMEFMQLDEIREFDLDKHAETISQDDIDNILEHSQSELIYEDYQTEEIIGGLIIDYEKKVKPKRG